LSTFVFRGDRYDSSILEKICNEGFRLEVDSSLVIHKNIGDQNKLPVAIKVEGNYHLLQGKIPNTGTVFIQCVTKHTLKKCKVETIPQRRVQTFQEKWNSENSNRSRLC